MVEKESFACGESRSVCKRFLILSLLAVACAGQTASQSAPVSQSSRSHRGAAPGGERSMKGCLTKDESGAYFLQTQRNAKVKLDSAEDLASRVGRLVRVTGAFEDTHSGTTGGQSGTNQSRRTSSAQSPSVRAFRVFRVDVLSQTCSVRKK